MMRGTHGTSKVNSRAIIGDGRFNVGHGLRGVGAYFWDYTDDALRQRCLELAECHWRQSFGNTKQIKANTCVIIDVGFGIDTVVFDTLEQSNLEGMIQFVEKSLGKLKSCYSPKQVDEAMSSIYDSFIQRVEKAAGVNIHLFRFTVDVARNFFPRSRFPIDPTCVVVRNQDCIKKVAIIEKKDAPFKVA